MKHCLLGGVWVLVAGEAVLEAVYLLVLPPDFGIEFFDSLLH